MVMFGNKEKQLHERVVSLQMELAQIHDVFIALDKSLAIIEFDRRGHVLSANQNFVDLFKYSMDEVLGAHHKIFCDQAYALTDEYRQFWDKLNQGQFFSGKFKRVNKQGKTVWLEATYNPVFNSVGTLQKIVKYASDITERVQMEMSNQSLINALNRSMGVIEFSLEGKILSANENFQNIMGYSASELINQHHSLLCQPSLVGTSEYEQFWERLRSGEFSSGVYSRIKKDGSSIELSATYNPCFDQDGRLSKIIKITQPVIR